MRLNWRARLEHTPGLRDMAQWPAIPLDSLPRRYRKPFLRNQRIVADALAGAPLKTIAARHAVSPGRVSQLLARCLGGEDTAPPALNGGLVPHRPVGARRRTAALPTLQRPSGHVCTFEALLEALPTLREAFDAMILAKLKDAPYAQRPSPGAAHGLFKRLLAEAQWPRDRYPYTTVSLAYESVRRHLHRRTAELAQARQLRRQRRPRDLGLPGQRRHALRAVQIDEHTLDLGGRVQLVLNDELIPLRVARASVLVAVDVDTGCVLGYHLAPTRYPTQQDLLTLIDHCVHPWQPLDLVTPGLAYTPGACFPSALQGAFPISFGTVQLDNALMHRAHSIVTLLCEHYGATLSLGPPAMPKLRDQVEAIFNYINQRAMHRVAATTGSSPTDPSRESRKNRKGPPAVTFQTVNEALSVMLTEYNVTTRPALGNATPLALFEHDCRHHFLRFVPPSLARQWHPLIGSAVVRLHWYRHEHRLPHVNFAHARYQGSGLLGVAAREAWIRVQFDRRDIRTLQAYTPAGTPLGVLQVSTPWQRFPHPLTTRQWIHKNARGARLNARDPLAAYFQHLLAHKGEPSEALSLLRVYTEFTRGEGGGLMLDPAQRLARSPRQRYRWRPELANHR